MPCTFESDDTTGTVAVKVSSNDVAGELELGSVVDSPLVSMIDSWEGKGDIFSIDVVEGGLSSFSDVKTSLTVEGGPREIGDGEPSVGGNATVGESVFDTGLEVAEAGVEVFK